MLMLLANHYRGFCSPISWSYGSGSGVESRLATLTVDMNDLSNISAMGNRPDLPSTFQPTNISQLAITLPAIFNMLIVRRAIIPAANGHLSARALARYYAALADLGLPPPPHSSSSKPPLGSHPHIPKFPSPKPPKKRKCKLVYRNNEPVDNEPTTIHIKDGDIDGYTRLATNVSSSSTSTGSSTPDTAKMFDNPRIHDAFMGVGEYENFTIPGGKFGLGFRRTTANGSLVGFGHSGMGGSTGFCDVKNRFAIAVTVNKMSFGTTTRKIVQLVCSELNIPVPEDYSGLAGGGGPDSQLLNIGRPMIN